jgi:signal transduction histidine kinase
VPTRVLPFRRPPARPDVVPAAGDPAGPPAAPRRPWARWAAWNGAVWLALVLVYTAQGAVMDGRPAAQVFVGCLAGFFPCMLFGPVITAVALRWRFAEGERGRAALAHLGALLLFLVGGGAAMGLAEHLLPWAAASRVGPLAAAAGAVRRYAAVDVLLYTLIAAGALAAAYARESRERAVAAAQLQAQLAEARLHALAAQLHPHMLFNALHAISALVRPDPRRAEQLIARLSDLLRHALETGGSAETSLDEELGFVAKYLDIQQARYGDRLAVRYDVAPEARGARVPRLVLQPLVENAVQHGIARRAAGGTVTVAARVRGAELELLVRDDGAGLPAAAPAGPAPPGGAGAAPARAGVGLAITRARLRQLYGDAQALTVVPAPPRGTLSTVRLPLRPAAPGGAAPGAAPLGAEGPGRGASASGAR